MPRQVLDWIEGYLQLTHNSEPPTIFREWVAVSTVAACLQRKCYLPWGSLTFYPNLYVVLVAPAGAARKGTAMGPGLDFLTEPGLNVRLAAEAITREALIRELKNASDNAINADTGQMMFHASLTIFSQELTVFLGYNNVQLMSDLADWFDCRKKWTYRTKWSGSDEIEGVWVNLIGATTPKLIQSAMPLDAIGLGLTSRMIFVYEEKKGKIVPDPFISRKEMELRAQLVTDLTRISQLQGPFKVTGEFVSLWTEWYLQQEGHPPFQDDRFAGYFERRPTHVMKLSMIFNASRTDSMTITDTDLQRAISFLTSVEKKMPLTFSGLGKSSQADILARCMAYIGNKKEVTYDELMYMFRNDASKWDLDNVLESLQAMKFCSYVLNTGRITKNPNFGH